MICLLVCKQMHVKSGCLAILVHYHMCSALVLQTRKVRLAEPLHRLP